MQATPGDMKSFRSSAERKADMFVVLWRCSRYVSPGRSSEEGLRRTQTLFEGALLGDELSN